MSYSIQLEQNCTTLLFRGNVTFPAYNQAIADVWDNTAYRGKIRQIRNFEDVESTALDHADAHVFAEMDRIAYRDADDLSIAFVSSQRYERAGTTILAGALSNRGIRAMIFSTLSSARRWFGMPPETEGCRFYRYPMGAQRIA